MTWMTQAVEFLLKIFGATQLSTGKRWEMSYQMDTLRRLHISLCWLGPCRGPWPSAGDSKNGHRFFLSLPMLSAHPIPHQLWVKACDLLYSRPNTSQAETWKVFLCWGVPFLVVLGTLRPSCKWTYKGMSGQVEEKCGSLANQATDWRPMG